MMAVLLVVTLARQQPGRPPAPVATADTTSGRPCKVAIDSIGKQGQQVAVRAGETNVFAGGGVLAHCEGTGTTLAADSVAWFAGTRRFDMMGQATQVHIRDTAMTLDATNASYYLLQQRLEAHRNVVAVNRISGSVLRGPNLTYYRTLKGVRDTIEMYASSRPTIEYRMTADSGEPYLIVADRVRFKGNDRMWGGGQVTIDRSDFAARGDSVQLDQTTGFGVLVGRPRVEGKGARSYTLTGTRIELGLASREVRLVKALGHGVATGSDWRLTADTIHLHVARKKLQQAFAWGPKDSIHAQAVSTLHTIRADSLAVDLPDEVLTEVRAFSHAFSTSKKDSTAAADLNWITGDSLTARWAQQADSGRSPKSALRQIIARGSARALSHFENQRDSTGPSLNYSRGATINITLRGDKIDRVVVGGRADGVQLEPKPPAPPDTTKKAPARP
jgi:hypothetical protein